MYVGEGCSYYNSIVILVSENDKNVIVHLVKNSVGKTCIYYSKLDFLNLLGCRQWSFDWKDSCDWKNKSIKI